MVYQIAMVFFILYGLGIPVALAGILTREKHDLAKLRCIASYGFLYTNYRRKNYYWESVILVRKVLIVLSVGLPETVCGLVLFVFPNSYFPFSLLSSFGSVENRFFFFFFFLYLQTHCSVERKLWQRN